MRPTMQGIPTMQNSNMERRIGHGETQRTEQAGLVINIVIPRIYIA
jgi:hypothetical protein